MLDGLDTWSGLTSRANKSWPNAMGVTI